MYDVSYFGQEFHNKTCSHTKGLQNVRESQDKFKQKLLSVGDPYVRCFVDCHFAPD